MNRSEVQPYFRAFMIARGLRDSSEADNFDFMCWIRARWIEFEIATGREVDPVKGRQAYAGEFRAWLEDGACDRLAQEHVEGIAL